MDNFDLITTVSLSIKMGLLATLINLPLAIAISVLLGKKDFKGKGIIDGIINLPLVMPPVITGYLLLLLLGKKGIIGSILFSHFNIRIAFTPLAVVIASMVVSFPLMAKSIRISIQMLDPKLDGVAKTLGASSFDVFARVTLPQVIPGIVNGAVLGFARCLGEFGATITFAGNIQGITRTIPLDVYSKLQIPGKEQEAAILVITSVLISFISLFISNLFEKNSNKGKESKNVTKI